MSRVRCLGISEEEMIRRNRNHYDRKERKARTYLVQEEYDTQQSGNLNSKRATFKTCRQAGTHGST